MDRRARSAPEPSHRRSTADRPSAWIDAVMEELASCPPGPRHQAMREAAIRALLPLARRLTHRYQGHGEETEDLLQVAFLGLVKAVDGFVPSHGHPFLAYAVPTVVGEMKRHLRDRTRAIRLPRSVQQASGPVFRAFQELEQQRGGVPPGVDEVAAHTGLEAGLVTATLRAVRECHLVVWDGTADEGELATAPYGPGTDRSIDRLVDLMALASAVRLLGALERRVLHLRFYEDYTQQQIAAAVGISQARVSRVLAYCFRRLRVSLITAEDGAPVPGGASGAAPVLPSPDRPPPLPVPLGAAPPDGAPDEDAAASASSAVCRG